MRNGDGNLLILTLYIIGLTYTFNQMVDSIDDKIKIEFNKSEVEDQLKEQNLQDTIGISFSFGTMYSINDPKELSISIENKSENLAIYVDWDNCAIEEFDGVSRRVIRKSPDVTRDLAVPQNPSLIVPKKTLKEAISSESVFQLDPLTKTYTPQNPVAHILKWKDSKIKAQRKQYSEFMSQKRDFIFALNLVLRLAETRVGVVGNPAPPLCIIRCPFTVKKLSWTYALPWNKKR